MAVYYCTADIVVNQWNQSVKIFKVRRKTDAEYIGFSSVWKKATIREKMLSIVDTTINDHEVYTERD